ncbi:hypothetical protein GCM10010169_33990 [Micromonospora fulviviridis]|nr:hypothetical protein GCM10010169_33990 [Micromonospora fulviviridis]
MSPRCERARPVGRVRSQYERAAIASETSVPDERRSQSRRPRAGLRDGAMPGYFDDRDVLGLVPVAVAPTMPRRGLTRVEGTSA